MPRIYELPASPKEHQPSDVRFGGGVRPQQLQQRLQQPQGSANPRNMLANQMDMELGNVTRNFDIAAAALGQQGLEPDQHKKEYEKLQYNAMVQYTTIQAKHDAAAQHIKNMRALVRDGMLTQDQMDQTMLVMAGVPVEHVRKTYAQAKRQKPITRLRDIEAEIDRIQNWRGRFKDEREDPWYRGGKGDLSYKDIITGKKNLASPAETKAYDASPLRLAELDKQRQEIMVRLTPMEQYSRIGSQAVSRFGMSRIPSLAGQRFGGGIRMAEPIPKKQPTAAELRGLGTREAYEQGKRLGYWN